MTNSNVVLLAACLYAAGFRFDPRFISLEFFDYGPGFAAKAWPFP